MQSALAIAAVVIGVTGPAAPVSAASGWVAETAATPTPGPMAFDSKRHVVLMFNGTETWQWSTAAATWTKQSPAHQPLMLGGDFAMAFDSTRGVAVLIVSAPTTIPAPTDTLSTWQWDGTDWTEMHPAHSPTPRFDHSQNLAFDSQRSLTVLFSGQWNVNFQLSGDTWEWNGADWTQNTTAGGSLERYAHCMAYDSDRHRVVLQGGEENHGSGISELFFDTWEYNGQTWTLAEQNGFSAIKPFAGCSMTYDPVIGRTINIARSNGTSGNLTPFYWDGTTWTMVGPDGPNLFRWRTTYDSDNHAVVMVGVDSSNTNQTWLLNPLPAPPGPGAPPSITSISPTRGPTEGGTKVTITGLHFTGTTAVSFHSGTALLQPCGQQPAGLPACFTVDSDTQITAFSPALDPGSANIYVVTPNGLSASTPADVFTYEGWLNPTPPDQKAFDVPITNPPQPVTFTVTLLETDPALIGHTQLPDSVTCSGNQNPGNPASLNCTVSPLHPGLDSVTFFDANNPARVTTRTYIVGRGFYVAMGESYSAGEGNDPKTYIPPTNSPGDQCHRSTVAYGEVIAGHLYNGDIKFVACSGAVILDAFVRGHQYPNEGYQLSSLGPQTDLVTMSMGGNDIFFDHVGTACLTEGILPLLSQHCEYDPTVVKPTYDAIKTISTPGTSPPPYTLDNLYQAIHAAAPNARVVVLTYPRLAPKDHGVICGGPTFLPTDEALFANNLAADLDNAIQKSGARNNVEVVDGFDAFDGHELCQGDSYVNPVDLGTRENSLHPNPKGQAKFASLVETQIKQGPPGSDFLVRPGQKAVTVVPVNAGMASVSFQISWPGSDIATSLVSPSGRVIDRTTSASDVLHVKGSNYEVFTVTNPESGSWNVSMKGVSVSPDGEIARFNQVQLPRYNLPPAASLSASPTDGTGPLTVNFDATASSDPDGSVVAYAWDFGDGTTGAGPTATHVYPKAGRYYVGLAVTDDGGRQGFASTTISVRDNKIAFSSTRDGHFQVYVMSANGTQQTRLTNSPASDSESVLSPDGTRVAFISTRSGHIDIWAMNAAPESSTNVPVNLTHNGATSIDPTWSPDGSKIAFASDRTGKFQIYVMNADGTGLTRLTSDAANDVNPAWSPDGTRLAFASDTPGRFQIYLANISLAPAPSLSGVVRLTTDGATDLTPAWSPDSKLIAYTGTASGSPEIWVVASQPGGTAVRQTANAHVGSGLPSWSPDGTKIVFTGVAGWSFQVFAITYNPSGLGSGQVQLTSGAANAVSNWCCTSVP